MADTGEPVCRLTGGDCMKPCPPLQDPHAAALQFFLLHGARCSRISPAGGVVGLDFVEIASRAALLSEEEPLDAGDLILLEALEDAYIEHSRVVRLRREAKADAARDAGGAAWDADDDYDADDDAPDPLDDPTDDGQALR